MKFIKDFRFFHSFDFGFFKSWQLAVLTSKFRQHANEQKLPEMMRKQA